MRKSEIETDIEGVRLQCEAEDDPACETQLCDSLNCPCAREILAQWTSKVYDQQFSGVPIWFCTLYLERDIVPWDKLGKVKLRNLKTRFKRLLQSVGLGDAVVLGVLDAVLIARAGMPGNPPPRWHFHWHFFIRKQDLTAGAESLVRARLKKGGGGLKPFVKMDVTTQGFHTAYLWKPAHHMARRIQWPSGRLCLFRRGYVKGRYLGAMQAFMIRNPGLTWLFLQGLRRSSGRIIVRKCVQQGGQKTRTSPVSRGANDLFNQG